MINGESLRKKGSSRFSVNMIGGGSFAVTPPICVNGVILMEKPDTSLATTYELSFLILRF